MWLLLMLTKQAGAAHFEVAQVYTVWQEYAGWKILPLKSLICIALRSPRHSFRGHSRVSYLVQLARGSKRLSRGACMTQPYYRNNNMSHYRSTASGRGAGNQPKVDEAARSLMESENDMRWMELGERVDMLKSLSHEIHQEVKSQNSLLDSMGDSFGNVSGLFSSTIAKLGDMMGANSSQHMYYLVFFIVFVFLVLYFMMRR